ncbi:MAG: protein kinase, partial [Planctomycetes bacterium]|nr:protein kinase [Planctomycetota bacterium]
MGNAKRPDPAPSDDSDMIDLARRQARQAKNADELELPRESPKAASDFSIPPADSFTGYSIVREIHRGGQGVVFQAIQKSTKRKVAIKVMKEGPFAGSSDKARFDREVQILGQLDHPNIVAVHDTGVAAGCHYFVMDYVSGQPLDVAMASDVWTVDQTLKLFAKICVAVNAAHLRGVIHRDLKPSNIRIDSEGQPHVLDFGLAKVALGSAGVSPADVSPMTMTGQFVGTLPWASPEQAEGVPSKIDLRTDVYSLGVVLYQMLTGKFPYPVLGTMRDVIDNILTTEPASPRALRKQINDEVETIVLKCLQKERDRRYQTAGELARDVNRYLAGDPIDAKGDSLAYVLRKQLKRYKLPAAVAAAFLVTVFGFAVAMGIQARNNRLSAEEAENEARNARLAENEQRRLAAAESVARDEAERDRKKAETIIQFVTKALVSSDPNKSGAQGFLVTEAMQQAIELLDASELKNEPETEAALLATISGILIGNARSEEALRLARRVLEIELELHSGDHPEVATSLNNLSNRLSDAGDAAGALEAIREAVEIRRRL